MATITGSGAPRRRIPSGLIVVGCLTLALLIGGSLVALNPPSYAPAVAEDALPAGWQRLSVASGVLEQTVGASGSIESARQAEVRFTAQGQVTSVLVQPGDTVAAGQVLAAIDAAALDLAIARAEADLAQARASLSQLLEQATPEELAASTARIAQAREQLNQVQREVSASDVAAARAELEQARAQLAVVEQGASGESRTRVESALQQAQADLDQARTALAVAKEQAERAVTTAANHLRNAQDEYSRIYWENRKLEGLPGDLPQARVDMAAAALRAVQDGEVALRDAQQLYEQARQDEIAGLRSAEAALSRAAAEHDATLAGPGADELAAARAAVRRAEANLARLTDGSHASAVAAQAAAVQIAEADHARLQAPPSDGLIAGAEAAVTRAQVALDEARLARDEAVLRAPFAATVAEVALRVGEPAGQQAIALVELSELLVRLPVDELDIAQVQPGLPVRVTLDALADVELAGTVVQIAPRAERSEQGSTTYEVTVQIEPGAAPVRPGMSAAAEIIAVSVADSVLLPRAALQTEGGRTFVLVHTPEGQAPNQWVPAHERREVTIGLDGGEHVQVLSGLAPGEEVLIYEQPAPTTQW